MGSLHFGRLGGAIVAVSLALLPACGGHKPAASSPFAARVTLNPSISYSIQVGTALQLSASAQNSSNKNLATTFTYSSTDPSVLDVSPNGAVCAGTWNAPTYSICTPGGIGVAQVTASALGGTSPPTLFFVHAPIDNIQISIVPPINSQPPACPAQQALPAACNLKFNTAAAAYCLSQNQVQTLQATALSGSTNITSTVGPLAWNEISPTVARLTPIVTNFAYNVPTNQVNVSPGAPGQTQVIASAAGVFSQPYYVETCPIQCIDLELGTNNSGVTSFTVGKGTAETITATAVDVQGCIVPKPPLTWTSSAPASIAAGTSSAGCSGSTTCSISTTQPGVASITASCSPPTCNIGFPLNPTGNPAPYIPQPVYPITSISGLVTGAPTSTSVFATSQDCSSNELCSVATYYVATSNNLEGNAISLPTQPNSLLFDSAGDKAFMGSQFGSLSITPANFTGNSSPFDVFPAPGTQTGLVTGKVLAVSPTGGMAIFSDTISTPNRVYVVTSGSSSSSVPLNINNATAAAFSPDSLKAFILADGGNSLYIYSSLQALTGPIALPTPATSIVFNSSGAFALLTGGGTPSNLAAYNTCDNSPVTPALPSGAVPSPPQFLTMVPWGSVPMGGLYGNVVLPALQTAGLDFFFGVDDTGIDIIATNNSLLPLPLPSGPLSLSTLCPRSTALALTAATPATFAPVHIDIGHGTFHPINFFLSPDATKAYIVTSDFGVLIYNFSTNGVSAVPLVNNATPVAAGITIDDTLIYVAGSDGFLHEVNTNLDVDLSQIQFSPLPNSANSFCFNQSNCQLNIVAVKP